MKIDWNKFYLCFYLYLLFLTACTNTKFNGSSSSNQPTTSSKTLSIAAITPTTKNPKTTGSAAFTVTLSEALNTNLTFSWSTIDGTGVAEVDYTGLSNQFATIMADSTSTTISVPVLPNDIYATKNFSVQISNPSISGINIGTSQAIMYIQATGSKFNYRWFADSSPWNVKLPNNSFTNPITDSTTILANLSATGININLNLYAPTIVYSNGLDTRQSVFYGNSGAENGQSGSGGNWQIYQMPNVPIVNNRSLTIDSNGLITNLTSGIVNADAAKANFDAGNSNAFSANISNVTSLFDAIDWKLSPGSGASGASDFDNWFCIYDESYDVFYDTGWSRHHTDVNGSPYFAATTVPFANNGSGFSKYGSVTYNGYSVPMPSTYRVGGSPSCAGVIRLSELKQGKINHAVAFMTKENQTLNTGSQWPTMRQDGTCTSATTCITYGSRLQLDPTLTDAVLSAAPYNLKPYDLIIAHAMQEYGMILVDTGGSNAIMVESGLGVGEIIYGRNASWGLTPYSWPAGLWSYFKIIQPMLKDTVDTNSLTGWAFLSGPAFSLSHLHDSNLLNIFGITPGSNPTGNCQSDFNSIPYLFMNSCVTGAVPYPKSGFAKLNFTQQPSSSIVSGMAFGTQPILKAQDYNGATITSFTGSLVLAMYTDSNCTALASGTLNSGTQSVLNGVVTFSSIAYTGTAGTYYLRATFLPAESGANLGITKCSSAIVL